VQFFTRCEPRQNLLDPGQSNVNISERCLQRIVGHRAVFLEIAPGSARRHPTIDGRIAMPVP
jgi:hypothetical protein